MGLCSQYSHREGLYCTHGTLREGLCSQYLQRGGCAHSTHGGRGLSSWYTWGGAALTVHMEGLHLLVLTGIDELH